MASTIFRSMKTLNQQEFLISLNSIFPKFAEIDRFLFLTFGVCYI